MTGKLYRFHSENVRELKAAKVLFFRSMRGAVAAGDARSERLYLKSCCLLMAALAESSLQKLLHEPGAFSDKDRSRVNAQENHLARWEFLVELSFRNHFSIPNARLVPPSISFANSARYEKIIELLQNDLGTLISVRNKLAHGQWVYPLNATGTAIAQDQMDFLRDENPLSLQLKSKMLDALLQIILDLGVSGQAFERDFDHHFRRLSELRHQLENKSTRKWRESHRRSRRQDGLGTA